MKWIEHLEEKQELDQRMIQMLGDCSKYICRSIPIQMCALRIDLRCREDPEVVFRNPSVFVVAFFYIVDSSPAISKCIRCSIGVDSHGRHAVSSAICFLRQPCVVVRAETKVGLPPSVGCLHLFQDKSSDGPHWNGDVSVLYPAVSEAALWESPWAFLLLSDWVVWKSIEASSCSGFPLTDASEQPVAPSQWRTRPCCSWVQAVEARDCIFIAFFSRGWSYHQQWNRLALRIWSPFVHQRSFLVGKSDSPTAFQGSTDDWIAGSSPKCPGSR